MVDRPKKPKKLGSATGDFAVALGLRPNEWAHIQAILGRPPSELECHILVNLWSDSGEEIRITTSLHPKGGSAPPRVSVLDVSQPRLVAASAAYQNVLSRTFPGVATNLLIAGLLESLAAFGAHPHSVGLLFRLGDLETETAQGQIRSVTAAAHHYLNGVGCPLSAFQFLSDRHLDDAVILNGFVYGLVDGGEGTTSARTGEVGAMVLFVGEPFSGALATDPLRDQSEGARVRRSQGSLALPESFRTSVATDALLAAYESGIVLNGARINDRGLAGALFELGLHNSRGVAVDLEKLPRDGEIAPDALFSSRIPHQFLAVAAAETHRDAVDHFARWGLRAGVIGELIEAPEVQVTNHNVPLGSLPLAVATERARESSPRFTDSPRRSSAAPLSLELPGNLDDTWLDLLASPNLASRMKVLAKFDHLAGGLTVGESREDLSCFLSSDKGQGIACALEGETFGIEFALALGIQSLAACGATAVGLLPIFNVGNLERERVVGGFNERFVRLLELSEQLGLALLGERASFYNPLDSAAPPVVTALFLIGTFADAAGHIGPHFRNEGDRILVLGPPSAAVRASEYARIVHGVDQLPAPEVDFGVVRSLARVLVSLVSERILFSAHAVGAGGLAVALAQAGIASSRSLGASVQLDGPADRGDILLFGEAPGRYLITIPPECEERVRKRCAAAGVPISGLGSVGGDYLEFSGALTCSVALGTAEKIFHSGLDHIFSFSEST